jgi:sortase A
VTVRIPHWRRPRFAARKLLRPARWVFLTVGLLAVGYSAYHYFALYVYQQYESRAFNRAVAAIQAGQDKPLERSRSLVGRITIPRLGISAIMKEGVDAGTLAIAVGHIPSTALPGDAGNVGIAAHRDTFFRNLKGVRQNDEITLATLDGAYVYRVFSFEVVNPDQVSVLAPSMHERTLTMVTCYPFFYVGHAPKRFIVHARQVSSTQISASAQRYDVRSKLPGSSPSAEKPSPVGALSF